MKLLPILGVCVLLTVKVQSAPIVVAADGSGAFTTVQAAVDSIPAESIEPQVILIKPGTYKARVHVPAGRPLVTFKGEDADPAKTVLTFDLNANMLDTNGKPVGTSGTPSTNIQASDFTAENITFENTAGDKGQALALKITGDRGVFRNCRFLGWQDTLCADGGRQYFANCYIEGRVDFIFGGSTAVFDHCIIHSKNGGYVTAARTPPEQPYGYIFLDCTLTGEGAPAYLGRPWQWDRGRNAMVAFIQTKMGPHIRPEGWNAWDRPGNPNTQPAKTCRYSEFQSLDLDGKPLDISKRVPWSSQLSYDQAAKLMVNNILGGSDHWNPTSSTEAK